MVTIPSDTLRMRGSLLSLPYSFGQLDRKGPMENSDAIIDADLGP
jgi:hypothetical protein